MTLLLHLSDIHLGDLSAAQIIGDYKSDSVPMADRENRVEMLRSALAEVDRSLQAEGRTLDAVVISGDITLQSNRRGFELLDGLLAHLGRSRPEPPRIVVVPGNHDVMWFTPPGSHERYEPFLKHVRDAGFTTPPLDGVDESLDREYSFARFARHACIDPDFRWAIIPINSANYCGVLDSADVLPQEWDRWATELDRNGLEKPAQAAFKKIRLRDMPRVSPWQLNLLRRFLTDLDREAERAGRRIIKIVTLHHQLLPVSPVEENKPFESFANLGVLRSFLANHRIDVVLHGHKHTPFVYSDAVPSFETNSKQVLHRVVVVSGGTVGMNAPSTNVCRLLELKTEPAGAPMLFISGLSAPLSGHKVIVTKSQGHPLWREAAETGEPNGPLVVRGTTVHETYARIRALLDGLDASVERYSVVTVVETATDAGNVPTTYPDVAGVGEQAKQRWFEDTVAWWQLKESKLGDSLNFTHGSRIYRYGPSGVDQLEGVIGVLRQESRKTRAVITLVDPGLDHNANRRCPAFSLLQFVLRREADGLFLDAIAFFRNQEMRFWWPVNVAEIARLQGEVLNKIQGDHGGLRAGRITTVAAIATVGSAPQFVAVPELDRTLDMDEDSLWDMVYALVCPTIPKRHEHRARWNRMLDGLVPEPTADPRNAPVSIHGLEFLKQTILRFCQHHQSKDLQETCDLVEMLLSKNQEFRRLIENGGKGVGENHGRWVKSVTDIVAKMRVVLSRLFFGMED